MAETAYAFPFTAYESHGRLLVDTEVLTINGFVGSSAISPVSVTVSVNGSGAESITLSSDRTFSHSVKLKEGLNEIKVTATDGNKKTVQATFPAIRLITNRTENDIIALKELLNRPVNSWTKEEKTAFYAGRYHGFYSSTDLNRVVLAIRSFVKALREAGYFVPQKTEKEWSYADWLLPSDAKNYLEDVEAVRNALPLSVDTPQTPKTMEKLSLEEANSIEKILVLTDAMLVGRSRWYSGELHSGEV